jgi:hypothetical protein
MEGFLMKKYFLILFLLFLTNSSVSAMIINGGDLLDKQFQKEWLEEKKKHSKKDLSKTIVVVDFCKEDFGVGAYTKLKSILRKYLQDIDSYKDICIKILLRANDIDIKLVNKQELENMIDFLETEIDYKLRAFNMRVKKKPSKKKAKKNATRKQQYIRNRNTGKKHFLKA